ARPLQDGGDRGAGEQAQPPAGPPGPRAGGAGAGDRPAPGTVPGDPRPRPDPSEQEVAVPFASIDGIEVTLQDHLLRIRLNPPDETTAVRTVCARGGEADAARVVPLPGRGARFGAGAALRGAALSAGGGQIPPVSMSRNLFLALLELSKPLIGAINGVAAGG